MNFSDFLKNNKVKKTLEYGQAIGKIIRRKIEKKLDAEENKVTNSSLTPQEAVMRELLKNLQQFQAILNNRKVIGFLAISLFISKAWGSHKDSIKLPDNQKIALEKAYGFLLQCNCELESMEVRKDGFVEGQLSDPLLESGLTVLQRAIDALKNPV